MKQKFVAILLLFLLVETTPAIIVCHDYTLCRVTGKDPRPVAGKINDGCGVGELRKYLEKNGYKRFPYTNAAEDPERAGRFLKPGDVIVLRDDHSGFVNEKKLIDHFIQVFGASGTKYDRDSLPQHSTLGGKVGGLYLNETLKDFLSRPFYKGADKRLEIWRRVAK